MSTPQAVLDALSKLDNADREIVLSYIGDLQSTSSDPAEAHTHGDGGTCHADHTTTAGAESTEDATSHDEAAFPPLYESGEDFDQAGELKQKAAELKSSGDWEAALEQYTAAILVAPPSSLLYANRAVALLQLDRPHAAVRDCSEALKENPDSAKALRTRGKARKALGQWEAALRDLSASQQIDFDEGTVEDLKVLSEKRVEQEKAEAATRIKEEDRLRKKAADIKAAQEDAKREAEEEAAKAAAAAGGGFGGMPGGTPGGMGGMPGGMGGMPGGMGGMPPGMEGMAAAMMSDPELMAGMQNPKVMAAFQELMGGPGGIAGLMSNPAKLQKLMGDPEVGPILQKLMAKMGGGAMPGMSPGSMGGAAEEDDGIPNLDEMGDLDMDDLPDLE